MNGQAIPLKRKIDTPEAENDGGDILAIAIRNAINRAAPNDYSGAAIYAAHLSAKYGKDFFTADDLTKILGLRLNAAYELLHDENFPTIKQVGKTNTGLFVTAYELALWMQSRRSDLWKSAAGR